MEKEVMGGREILLDKDSPKVGIFGGSKS
jgi:hypothetical protein